MKKDINWYEELEKYVHYVSGKVMFDEVDLFGVVHNIKYLYWLERARREYFEFLGLINKSQYREDLFYMVVHAEIDYYGFANLFDDYKILTRIEFIKNTSIGFENIILINNTKPVVKASATLVRVDTKNLQPLRITDETRVIIGKYETNKVRFID